MLQSIAQLIRSKGQGLAQVLGNLANSLFGRNPVIGGLIGIATALLETRSKAQTVKTDPLDPLRIVPVNANYDTSANPASALFGLRGVTGAGAYDNAALRLKAQIELSLKGDFGELVAGKVASVLGGQNVRMAPA